MLSLHPMTRCSQLGEGSRWNGGTGSKSKESATRVQRRSDRPSKTLVAFLPTLTAVAFQLVSTHVQPIRISELKGGWKCRTEVQHMCEILRTTHRSDLAWQVKLVFQVLLMVRSDRSYKMTSCSPCQCDGWKRIKYNQLTKTPCRGTLFAPLSSHAPKSRPEAYRLA